MAVKRYRILIIGGSGQAGQRIAQQVSQWSGAEITLAGRRRERATAVASRLNQEAGSTVAVARQVDMARADQLSASIRDHHLIIIACALQSQTLCCLIEACIHQGADYVDIVPEPSKWQTFIHYGNLIRQSVSRFVLDAGVDPGLPGWLARYAAHQASDTRRFEMQGRYRSTTIGMDGVADIFMAATSQGWVYELGWRRVPLWDVKLPRFAGRLGRSLAAPVVLDELKELPRELGLTEFRFYHGGINPLTDLMMLLERTPLKACLAYETRQRFFHWALQRFTGAEGVALTVCAAGNGNRRIDLWHEDLYEATVVPAVAIAEALRSSPQWAADYNYLGGWAIGVEGFVTALERGGFQIEDTL